MSALMSELNSYKMTITLSAKLAAKKFAERQITASKRRQVYLNTLAISVVNWYLQCLGWETDLENSYSWNLELQTLLDVADILVPGCGRIECLCVEGSTQKLAISQDISEDTIACIVVNLSTQDRFAEILGFTKDTSTKAISLDSLTPIDNFPGYLASFTESSNLPQTLSKLSSWLTEACTGDWLAWDSLTQQNPTMAFRTPASQACDRRFEQETDLETESETTTHHKKVKRVKVWQLETASQSHAVALIVELKETTDRTVDIAIEICPADNSRLLPSGMIIDIMDEQQEIMVHAYIQADSELVEFSLSGQLGEIFSIRATLNATTVTESIKI